MKNLFLAFAIAFLPSLARAVDCKESFELTLKDHVKMKFCGIPAAQGVNIGSENGRPDETPVIPRNFKKFQIAQFEVSQLQFKTVIGIEPWKENGSLKSYVEENDQNPADYITYEDAKEFAKALNLIDQTATYRLPTEAEWEYAARSGGKGNYYWGEEFNADYAYFSENTMPTGEHARRVDSCPNQKLNESSPGYCANKFGLYHMLGNVREWTADSVMPNYENAPVDGHVAVIDDSVNLHSIRGGCWFFGAESLRSSDRGAGSTYYGTYGEGFRLVRIAKE